MCEFLETVTLALVKTAMQLSSHACPAEKSGVWIVGMRWHSVAFGDRLAMGSLPSLVPLIMQLLAVSTETPLSGVGCSCRSGVEWSCWQD